MAIAHQTMTDEQRKSVALEYFRRADQGGNVLELFSEDAQGFTPVSGVAYGIQQIAEGAGKFLSLFKSVRHDYAHFNYIIQGDIVVVEGTTSGVTANGTEFRAGVTLAGYFCTVFEIRDFKIQRAFIYLDPNYTGAAIVR